MITDEHIRELQIDLLHRIEKKCDRRAMIIGEPSIGFPPILEGKPYEDNTLASVKKGNGKYFRMYYNLEGEENGRHLDELADFFVEYLRQSIEVDMKMDMFKLMVEEPLIKGELHEGFNTARK